MSTTIHLDARAIHAEGRSCPSCDGPLVPGDETCPHCGVSLRLPDPREGMELGGRYRLERQIGHGGTSAVYRAAVIGTFRQVAVKILDSGRMSDPHAVARFRDEVAKAREIHHPHAVQILDFGQMTDGTLYMVMELVRGENLAELLRREGTLPELRTIRLMKQVADVVGTAHRLGIVHRDLKPENIMVEPMRNGVADWVLVLDFGIAKLKGAPNESNTRTGVLIGTPYYMSPEQCQGKPLDARSDVYSLGVVMYEALTGHRPFDTTSDSVIPLLMKHIEERPRPMRAVKPDLEVGRELERLVMGALSKDPNWRPANGAELYAALDRVERIRMGKHLERTPRTADEVRRAVAARDRRDDLVHRPRAPRSRGAVLAMVVVLAAVAGAVWQGLRGRAPEAPSDVPPPAGPPVVRNRVAQAGRDGEGAPAPGPSVDVPATLAQGRRDLDARRWADAAERFELVRSADPSNLEAWLGLGRAVQALGRPRDAAAYLRHVMELGRDDRRLDVFVIQASKLLEQIERVDALLDQAHTAANEGRTDDAVQAFRAYLETRTDDAATWLELGRLLAGTRRKAEAETAFRNAARYSPSDAQVHHELGALLLSLNRRDDAIRELSFALELDPKREDTRRYLRMARNSGSLAE